jgi:hypothetical protein
MKDEKDDLRGRTKAFALRIIALYETLSRSGAPQVLGHQVLRSGTSVGANFRDLLAGIAGRFWRCESRQTRVAPGRDVATNGNYDNHCQEGSGPMLILSSLIPHPSSLP